MSPKRTYDARAMSRAKKVLLGLGAAVALIALLIISNVVCISAYLKYGMAVEQCPSGDVLGGVRIDAYGLRRGTPGQVQVGAYGYYTTGPADEIRTASLSRITARLELLDGDAATPLEPKEGWKDDGDAVAGEIVLPKDLGDGDYKLRATVQTPLGEHQLAVPLAVYAPAKIHVITDRPLYEPGNTIHFRATVLRARDLAPLDGRPGRFEVYDPTGTLVLEEKAEAGAFGVASGSLPLDAGAPTGAWRVRWVSGSANGEVSVRVAPFQLPRFSVSATPNRPFYRPNDVPKLRGTVRYSSGAPVSGARVALHWRVNGAWPPPRTWVAVLPKSLVADAQGTFDVTLPAVPAQLMGTLNVSASLGATDASGDRVDGATSLLFSEDGIAVDVVTELADGLVGGFNNRVYLRATTPAGTPLAGVKLNVKRAWDATDEGVTVESDEDGVGSLQIDPGSPVNVVVPAMPVRPPPRPAPAVIDSITEMIDGGYVLADQTMISRWKEGFGDCAHLVSGSSDTFQLGLAVEPTGRINGVSTGGAPAARCLAKQLGGKGLPRGTERLYRISVTLNADLPSVEVDADGMPEVPSEVSVALARAALNARRCLSPDLRSGSKWPRLLRWAIGANGRLAVRFGADPKFSGLRPARGVQSCVEARLSAASLDADRDRIQQLAATPHFGYARLSIRPRASIEVNQPGPTTFLGYELAVSAETKDGEKIGETTLRRRPGTVPSFRIRATPTIAKPGDAVELSFLRGPSFVGELPKKIWLRSAVHNLETEVDREKKRARFTLPADAEGWFEASWGGGRALVYVQDDAELSVSVTPNKPKYRPGETATLAIQTNAGKTGTPAAVGLIGVDESLGQLVPLPGPSDMASLRDLPQMNGAAFGALDAKALTMGRIRGKNAIEATVLKVTNIPSPAEIDVFTSANGSTTFDPIAPLTDHFYAVLLELHAQVRKWEEAAPKEEMMTPKRMAELFTSARDAVQARGERVDDAYGRPLRLSRLPQDLLALTDPRLVVIEGTRMPEDVENWQAWVRKVKP